MSPSGTERLNLSLPSDPIWSIISDRIVLISSCILYQRSWWIGSAREMKNEKSYWIQRISSFKYKYLAPCKQNWHKTNRTFTICLVYNSTKQEMNRLIIRKTATSSVSYPLTRSYTNQDVHFKFRTTSQKWPTTWWHSINRTTLVLLLLIWFCVINNLKTEDLLQRLSHSE